MAKEKLKEFFKAFRYGAVWLNITILVIAIVTFGSIESMIAKILLFVGIFFIVRFLFNRFTGRDSNAPI